jgi:membrane protein YdbS with pleckstrin-like domain
MVSVLASSGVDRGFEPRSGQTKDYQIGISCKFKLTVVYNARNGHIIVSQTFTYGWLLLDFKNTHMQVSKGYMIQYSTIIPCYM